MSEALASLERRIAIVDKQILAWGRGNQSCRHLITIPGYGPILASAMAAIVVEPKAFNSGRHFAASLGLVPRQDGTGGKVRLGPISKPGTGYLRRLLVSGAWRCSAASGPRAMPGLSNCWRRRSACSSPVRSPTRWRASPGRS
jgi:transposase